MNREEAIVVIFTSFADFLVNMSAAWAFTLFDSIKRFAWIDLLTSLLLAILCLSTSIGIKLKFAYDKHT